MKNKSLIIGGIVLSLVIVLSIGTYAYWTITKSQEGENKLIGGCLSIDISEEDGAGIKLGSAWPISDFEGMQLEGYTFTVTNECEEPQDYRIDLDRLVEPEGQAGMKNETIATLLDYGVPTLYSELEEEETTEAGRKEKRVLAYDTVMGKTEEGPGSNTHTLRLWVDESSEDAEEQSKAFISKVQINAGQGIEKYYTPEECFTFESGSITAYDETKTGCTTDVVIPYEIGGVSVTQIGANAFKEKGLTSVEFPRSVTTTGNQAFAKNPTIEKIIFKDGLEQIGSSTFTADGSTPIESRKLEFIMFPNTLTIIASNSFANNSLKQVVIPDSVTALRGTAFENNMIENYVIGKGVTELTAIFIKNEIKHVVIPDHITSISSTFMNNPIETITIGRGLTSLAGSAFSNDSVCAEYVNGKKCYYGENYLKEVYIPNNVISIGSSVFGTTTSDVIIRTERTKEDFLANVTASQYGYNNGSAWHGDAQVIDCNGVPIYE